MRFLNKAQSYKWIILRVSPWSRLNLDSRIILCISVHMLQIISKITADQEENPEQSKKQEKGESKIWSHNWENNQKPFSQQTRIRNQSISKMRHVTKYNIKYRLRNSTKQQRVKTTKYQLGPSSKPSGYYRVPRFRSFKARNRLRYAALMEEVNQMIREGRMILVDGNANT